MKELLKKYGISQNKLASKLGLSVPLVSYIVNNSKFAEAYRKNEEIAQAIGCSLLELVEAMEKDK